MKGPLALRILTAAAIIAATYGAMSLLKAGIKTPDVVFPDWCYKDHAKKDLTINLPFQLANWSGEKTELDPKIFDQTGAKYAENRNYADDRGHLFSLHMALYDDVDAGIWHSPTSCYRTNGWQNREGFESPLEVEQTPVPKVYFTRWDKEGRQCLVVHWYQLDDRILYDRFGLGVARVALGGRPTWPPLIKVLIQGQVDATSDEDRDNIMNFAKQIYLWLNDPSHKTGAAAAVTPAPLAEKSNAVGETKTSPREKKPE